MPARSEQHQGDQHMDMMRMRHQRELWVNFAAITLGVWLVTSPFTFGYQDAWMTWSDVIGGTLIVIFGLLSINPDKGWARWANVVVGIWLLFAPLVFWAPSAVAYTNDTLVGALIIAFAILVPGMPGMRMMDGPDMPPGWSYNPSSWLQRAPVIALGLFSFFIARYLAAYQLGYIDSVWDPFFSTERVLDSDVSRAWPISDAGFGAVAYMLEALSGFMGNRQRWRTMPWMVLMFGILVIPLGITSIVLVILQPVSVGTWCTLCLVTALSMAVMIPLAVDEVVAMSQFMMQVRRDGKPFWVNFFKGGTLDVEEPEEHVTSFHSPMGEMATAMVRGVTVPWTLLASTAVGIWLMAAPPVLGSTDWAANSDFLIGPIVAIFAVSAMAEVVRPVRYINIPLGAWIAISPWLLPGATTGSTVNDIVAGLALIALSLPRSSATEEYGSWTARIR